MTYADILKRLREATGADREIDVAIYRMGLPADDFTIRILDGTFNDVHDVQLGHGGVSYRTGSGGSGGAFPIPHYTASLDAAITLVEKMLPDRESIKLLEDAGRWFCEIRVYVPCHVVKFTAGEEGCPTPALALLIALLEALSDKGEPKP